MLSGATPSVHSATASHPRAGKLLTLWAVVSDQPVRPGSGNRAPSPSQRLYLTPPPIVSTVSTSVLTAPDRRRLAQYFSTTSESSVPSRRDGRGVLL